MNLSYMMFSPLRIGILSVITYLYFHFILLTKEIFLFIKEHILHSSVCFPYTDKQKAS